MSSTDNKNTKNRTDHITELIKALPLVEGFPLKEEELWQFFNKAVKNPDISIRKLSTKKEKSFGPKRISGYNLFTKTYKLDDLDGKKATMKDKSIVWKELSDEERSKYDTQAIEQNTLNGFLPIIKKETLTSLQEKWKIEFEIWVHADESTRGPEPILPTRQPNKPRAPKVSEKQDIQASEDLLISA
jgi:hypothetical protein